MVTDVYIVFNDKKQLDRLGDTKVSPFFHYIDETTSKGRKEAFKLKSSWAAKLTPFILCKDGDISVKAFYSETGEDVIKSLIDFLNE